MYYLTLSIMHQIVLQKSASFWQSFDRAKGYSGERIYYQNEKWSNGTGSFSINKNLSELKKIEYVEDWD